MEILALWNNITKYMQIEVKSNRLNVTSHNYQYQKDEEPLNKAILQERSDDSYHRPKPFRNKKKKKSPPSQSEETSQEKFPRKYSRPAHIPGKKPRREEEAGRGICMREK